MRRQWWIIASSLVLLTSACGSGSTDDATGDTGESGAESAEGDFVPVSPIGEFLGWDVGANFDEEASQAEWEAKDREAQEAIAVCMAAEGFEYVPIDMAAQSAFYEEQFAGEEDWGSEEWTAKYGFGISTQRFSQAQVGPDLVGNNYSFVEQDEGPPDPNREYVESLSPGEAEAYYAALYGDDSGMMFEDPIWVVEDREPTDEELAAFEEEMMAMEQDYVPTGCEPVAYEEIYGQPDGADEELYQAFEEEFGNYWMDLETRFESHPDVVAYDEGVRACAQEKGVEFLTEEEAYEHFERVMDEAGLGWDAMPDPLADIDTSAFTEEDYERAFREFETTPLPADMLAALAEVQAEEISTAMAARECGAGWIQREQALQAVRIEIEEAFLAENADALAQFEGLFSE